MHGDASHIRYNSDTQQQQAPSLNSDQEKALIGAVIVKPSFEALLNIIITTTFRTLQYSWEIIISGCDAANNNESNLTVKRNWSVLYYLSPKYLRKNIFLQNFACVPSRRFLTQKLLKDLFYINCRHCSIHYPSSIGKIITGYGWKGNFYKISSEPPIINDVFCFQQKLRFRAQTP